MSHLYEFVTEGEVGFEGFEEELEDGADVNVRSEDGSTALMTAIEFACNTCKSDSKHWDRNLKTWTKMIDLLLAHPEIDVNCRVKKCLCMEEDDGRWQCQDNFTALHIACKYPDTTKFVRKLLAVPGIEINGKSCHGTPLALAVGWEGRDEEVVRLLAMQKGVDLYCRGYKNRTLEELARKDEHMLAVVADVRKEEKELQQHLEFHQLASDMSVLLDNASEPDHAESGDFVLVCKGGEELRCHRLILMRRCPTLAQGVTAHMREAAEGRWKVNGHDGPADLSVVKNLLTFIYTGRFKEERMGELLELAHMYMLPTLAQICRERIIRAINLANALKTLVLIERCTQDEDQKKKYKEEVLQFIKKHKKEILKMDDWPTFRDNYPDLVDEIVLTD